jgi:indolepyruvate ferredoxin oxidoreductase beta subunit
MIGKLAAMVGDDRELWLKAVTECVPQKTVDINVKAFNAGYDL